MQATEDAGLPPISVAPNQGKLLLLLARAIGARRILEIDTLGGYSTIWLARGLVPDGRLITIEWNPACAKVARANLARAGFAPQVEVREGSGEDVLPELVAGAPDEVLGHDEALHGGGRSPAVVSAACSSDRRRAVSASPPVGHDSRTNASSRARAYGNSTSWTNDSGVVVPSMSTRTARIKRPRRSAGSASRWRRL